MRYAYNPYESGNLEIDEVITDALMTSVACFERATGRGSTLTGKKLVILNLLVG
jgi:hypothetical protein